MRKVLYKKNFMDFINKGEKKMLSAVAWGNLKVIITTHKNALKNAKEKLYTNNK